MSVKSSLEQVTKSVMGALVPNEDKSDILDTLQAEHDEVQDLLKKTHQERQWQGTEEPAEPSEAGAGATYQG